MLGALCSPCCGCSVQASSEIHERLWQASVTVEVSLSGYLGQQGATLMPLVHARLLRSSQFVGGNDTPPPPDPDVTGALLGQLASEMQNTVAQPHFNAFGRVYRAEPVGVQAYTLTADLSAYGADQFGRRTPAKFVYEDIDTRIELYVSASEPASPNAEMYAAFEGSPCRLRTQGTVTRYRRNRVAQLHEVIAAGVSLSDDTDYAFFNRSGFGFNATETLSAALAFVNSPYYFGPPPGALFPAPSFTANGSSEVPAGTQYKQKGTYTQAGTSAWDSEIIAVGDSRSVNRTVHTVANLGLQVPGVGSQGATLTRDGATTVIALDPYNEQATSSWRFTNSDLWNTPFNGGMYSLGGMEFQDKGATSLSSFARRFSASGGSTGFRSFGPVASQYEAQSTITITLPA